MTPTELSGTLIAWITAIAAVLLALGGLVLKVLSLWSDIRVQLAAMHVSVSEQGARLNRQGEQIGRIALATPPPASAPPLASATSGTESA